MKNFIKNLWDTITTPFVSLAVHIGESRQINEDGSWDKYWERKNRRAIRKEQRRARKSRT